MPLPYQSACTQAAWQASYSRRLKKPTLLGWWYHALYEFVYLLCLLSTCFIYYLLALSILYLLYLFCTCIVCVYRVYFVI